MTDTSKEAVKRFKLVHDPEYQSQMLRRHDGTWVRASDYDALAQRCADLEARAEHAGRWAEDKMFGWQPVTIELAKERNAIAAASFEAAAQRLDDAMTIDGARQAIRDLTPDDALAKLDTIRAEERAKGRREGMREAAECRFGWWLGIGPDGEPDGTYCAVRPDDPNSEFYICQKAILAAMEEQGK